MITEKAKIPSPIKWFLIKLGGFSIVWFALYYFILGFKDFLNFQLTKFVSNCTLEINSWFFENTRLENQGQYFYIYVKDALTISVGEACNGLFLYLIFSALILSYKGHWLSKLIYILIGNFSIILVNAVRVEVLLLNYLYFPDYFMINHKITFLFVVYALVFVLWWGWVNKFSKIKLY